MTSEANEGGGTARPVFAEAMADPSPRRLRRGKRVCERLRRGKPAVAGSYGATSRAVGGRVPARGDGRGFDRGLLGLHGWARIVGALESVFSAIGGLKGLVEGTKRTKGTKGTVAGRAGVLVMAVCSQLHPIAVNCTKKNKKSENRGFNLE
jgi:hypothetical protein